MSDSYNEVQKAPEIEHAKKLAREAKNKPKAKAVEAYTIKDGKILFIKIKASGAYSTYIGTKSKWEKKEKGSFEKNVAKWKAAGLWISEDEYNTKCAEIREQLAQELDEKNKKKKG